MAQDQARLPPPAALMQLIFGKFVTQMISVAAHLGIADFIKDGSRDAESIAKAAGAHPDATYRLLRGLGMVGVLAEGEGKTFSLTPVGQLLRTDTPGSLAGMAKFMGEGWHSASWAELGHSIKTGDPAFKKVYGMNVFEWFPSHPKEAASFNEAMMSHSTVGARAVAQAYDFASAKTIVDIGGGHGLLISEMLKAAPQAKGILFDMPQVVEGAKSRIAPELAGRVEIVGGDFFKAVPSGGDIYTLKHILHDWSDDHSIEILRNIGKAMVPSGRVLVMEMVVTPPNVPHLAKLLDLEMLVVTHDGRERTEAEFAALFKRAGLELTRALPTMSPVTILEATKAK